MRAIGYLRGSIPPGVEADERYDELRRTDGSSFSAREPLAYWSDLLDAGVPPSSVRVIGLGGGRLTALELRMALALGAHVGVVREAGGEGPALLGDSTWGSSARLVELEPTAAALRAYLHT